MVADCIEDRFQMLLDQTYHAPFIEPDKSVKSTHTLFSERYDIWPIFNHYVVTKKENFEYLYRSCQRFLRLLESKRWPEGSFWGYVF